MRGCRRLRGEAPYKIVCSQVTKSSSLAPNTTSGPADPPGPIAISEPTIGPVRGAGSDPDPLAGTKVAKTTPVDRSTAASRLRLRPILVSSSSRSSMLPRGPRAWLAAAIDGVSQGRPRADSSLPPLPGFAESAPAETPLTTAPPYPSVGRSLDAPWDEDGRPCPNPCLCCWTRFGVDSAEPNHERHRELRRRWVEAGCPWPSAEVKPPQRWEPQRQLQAVEWLKAGSTPQSMAGRTRF